MAVSRLDRLFILLDTGTTPVTRKAAAQQLGEVVKLHPHELNNLLSKVLIYLRSANWDTRIAAGQAVEAIVKNVPEWNPVPRTKQEPTESSMEDSSTTDRLNFDRFDICRLLQHGASLLGSAGAEFEVQDEKSGEVDPKERIARQRKLLQKKLGLNMGEAIGMSTEELFNDEDLDYTPTSAALVNKQSALQAAELIDSEFRAGMSNRQKNKAKRMAKLFAKQRSRDAVETNEKSNDSTDGEPEEKRRKVANVVINQTANDSKVLIDNVPESSSLIEETNEWPLESFCEELCNDLFNPSWEVRHGAGTGLREILKAHGKSGGKMGDSTLEEMIQQHQEWLEDLVIRLLCVFALDRFGDFVSDEVVAPVRETCAQTLGVVLKHMNETGVHKTVDVLLKLLTQEQWEVRHGGLLGIKYALAVRQDVINTLLPKVLTRIIEGLQDLDDDVRAVAAASLVPVVESLVYLQTQKVPSIINTLWDSLLELDDLTASTNSIMTLLSSMLTYPQVWMELLSKASVQYVVAAACPWMGAWLCLMMQPSHLPIDLNMLLEVKSKAKEKTGGKVRQGQIQNKEVPQEYIAGADTIMEDSATRDFVVMRARMMAAKLLGALCCCICDPSVNMVNQEIKPAESLGQLLLFHLNSKSALQRISVALVICEWAALQKECKAVTLAVQPRLLDILSEHLYYDEIAVPFTRMQNECKQFISSLADANIEVGNRINNNVLTIDQANDLGQKPYLVQRRGAEFALTTIVKHFGAEMAVKLPHLWDAMVGPLTTMIDLNNFGMHSVQNNVLELWSLFDFLMPGFLGTERQFAARYGKPILASRDARSSSREQEAGVLAMDALHRQVLPFLLRRMKEDVLQDLPPKIIQDYYCTLSPLQLLLDCGLGNGSTSDSGTEAVVAQHRVLIFCQLKSMLDIVEHDLLKPHLPSVTYLRLDGSIPPGQRHSIVSRFNNDPSIDVLLLTTHVGGLGLNLTGADTVVFVEHDWNPMRDLQAMDRAHRIGQKRVVNVYRLITRGTLEEKIMGLQKFKMNIANTVISQENSSLQSMGTDQLLDLFTLDKDGKAEKADSSTSGKASMKSVLENLSDLWDAEQYDSEYNLETFMRSLE
ncbi:B-TFIID TATA-box binding protein associated factor 1 [Cricetulus griseus]